MDALTGLPDRTEFLKSVAALASDERGVLILFDVDDLRILNGRHGHIEVDRQLARLGSVIQKRCGPEELAARVGGDEFALILFEEDLGEVVREVGRIRHHFAEGSDGATLSVGIAEATRLEARPDGLALFLAADEALNHAKKERPGGLKVFRPPV
jgi:diguanylate cyclase (GGDEF)-like protein